MKSRIVGSLSEFAKDEPSQKMIWCRIWQLTQLSIIKSKQNLSKSSSILFIVCCFWYFDHWQIHPKVIRAFAHDLNLPMTFEVTLDTRIYNWSRRCYYCSSRWRRNLNKATYRFYHGKTDDDKSWDISREILDTVAWFLMKITVKSLISTTNLLLNL
jgi:hypothetical protein